MIDPQALLTCRTCETNLCERRYSGDSENIAICRFYTTRLEVLEDGKKRHISIDASIDAEAQESAFAKDWPLFEKILSFRYVEGVRHFNVIEHDLALLKDAFPDSKAAFDRVLASAKALRDSMVRIANIVNDAKTSLQAQDKEQHE